VIREGLGLEACNKAHELDRDLPARTRIESWIETREYPRSDAQHQVGFGPCISVGIVQCSGLFDMSLWSTIAVNHSIFKGLPVLPRHAKKERSCVFELMVIWEDKERAASSRSFIPDSPGILVLEKPTPILICTCYNSKPLHKA
jgi:hypothetical protein